MREAFPRGRFVWHELLTTEPDMAVQFYTKVMGWTVEAWNNDPSYRLWISGKAPVGGLMRLPEEAKRTGARPHWMPYGAVADLEETVRHAQSLGARLTVPPKDVPPGRFATLADPQGATFSI